MKNYIIKSATINLEDNNFISSIPTQLLKEQGLSLIPSQAYTILLELIQDGVNNNYEFINSYINIVLELIKFDGLEIPKNVLRLKTRSYTEIIEKLRSNNFIISIKKAYYNKLNPSESSCAIYTLDTFKSFTFISLSEDSIESKLKLEVEGLQETPLNNENFINTLLNTTILATEAIYAEYKYCIETGRDYKKFLSRVNTILSFTRSRSAGKGENVNRVYSSFTNLSRISRKFLVYDDNPFYEVDIKNCQPLLLICILAEMDFDIDENYIEDVTTGRFYEALMQRAVELKVTKQVKYSKNEAGNSVEQKILANRDDVKVLVYSDILFCTKLKDTAIVKIFKSLYPKVYRALKEITEQLSLTGEKLARPLQNMEADIVLSIQPKSNYFTVHDAIYLTDKSEIPNIKTKLITRIKQKSNGLIKELLFGNIEEFEIIRLNENDIEIVSMNLRCKNKFRNPNKISRLIQFKELYGKFTTKEVCDKLDITRRSFMNYKKQLKIK